jgi:hypothetical protein
MASLFGDDLAVERRARRTQDPTFAGVAPTQNAGLPGGTAGPSPTPPVPTPEPPTSTEPLFGPYQHGAVDLTKFTDPNYHTPKYDITRLLTRFNPALGMNQPGLIEALNALGFGTFSNPNGDAAYFTPNDNGIRQGIDPHPFMGDWITDFGGRNDWGYDYYHPPADPFAASMAAPAPAPSADPFGALPSWLTDGLNPADLVRLAYNSYLGREPAPQDVQGYTGGGSFQMNDPRLLNSLDAIAQSAEALQYAKSHPDQSMPAPPTPTMFQNSAAVGQALQRLALSLPQLQAGRTSGPQTPSDPLTAWLLALLGVA